MSRRSSKPSPSSPPRPPRVASTRDVVVRVRLRERELDDWKERAELADVTISEWIRGVVEAHNRQADSLKVNVS